MPPKAKFTAQEIINAAVEITRTKGFNAVTAREVGAVLGVSSRPLFTYFDTVEQLKREVYLYASNLYKKYLEDGLKMPVPFRGVGQQYIMFAKDEPELYKILFLMPPSGISGGAMDALRLSQNLVRDSLMQVYNIDGKTADKYFQNLWLVAFSFATLIVTNDCPYTDEQMWSIFSDISLSVCKAYKEIPGFAEGNCDNDAVFRELVKKSNCDKERKN